VWKAASDGADVIVLLGFDLWNSGTNNNLYAGHKNLTHNQWILDAGYINCNKYLSATPIQCL
jgi:hypothetical protein